MLRGASRVRPERERATFVPAGGLIASAPIQAQRGTIGLRNLRRMAQYIRHLPGLERAEWLWAAARGGEALLRRAHPHLLLSVHPPALPGYGHSKAEVEAFLRRLGYDLRCLAVDHEEHWWCGPRT
jgi:hypothetical protein